MKKLISHTILVLLGNALLAIGYAAFAIPTNLIVGGATGMALVIEHITSIDYALIVFVINMLMLVIGYYVLGKAFAIGTLLSSFAFPAFLSLFENMPILQNISDDILLCTVWPGIFVGLGLGLAFKVGGSTGGVDIPAVIIAEKFHISIDKVVFVIDAIIIAIGIIPLGLMNVIIGLISNIVYTLVIDRVLVGGKKSIFVQIISKENEKINEFIQTKLDRGSTYFNVKGGYKGDEHKLLEVIVYRREYSQLIDFIHSVDANAFVISLESKEVFGEGFKQYDKETIK